MLQRIRQMFALTVLVLSASACEKQARQNRLEGRQISELEIRTEGNDLFDETRFRTLIASEAGTLYSQGRIDEDIKRLYESGFVADVSLFGEADGDEARVIAQLTLPSGWAAPGFVGNHAFSDRRLAEVSGLKAGTELNSELLEQAARRIETFYKANGHCDASVRNRGEAIFVIDEGEQETPR